MGLFFEIFPLWAGVKLTGWTQVNNNNTWTGGKSNSNILSQTRAFAFPCACPAESTSSHHKFSLYFDLSCVYGEKFQSLFEIQEFEKEFAGCGLLSLPLEELKQGSGWSFDLNKRKGWKLVTCKSMTVALALKAPSKETCGVYQWMENKEVLQDSSVCNSLINRFAPKGLHVKVLKYFRSIGKLCNEFMMLSYSLTDTCNCDSLMGVRKLFEGLLGVDDSNMFLIDTPSHLQNNEPLLITLSKWVCFNLVLVSFVGETLVCKDAVDQYSLVSIEFKRWQTIDFGFLLIDEEMIKEFLTKVKYCDTYMLYCPSHCTYYSLCNNGVKCLDHWCPSVSQYMESKKIRIFWFVSSATILCTYVCSTSIFCIKVLRYCYYWKVGKAMKESCATDMLVLAINGMKRKREIVSSLLSMWNPLINEFAQQGMCVEVLKYFRSMKFLVHICSRIFMSWFLACADPLVLPNGKEMMLGNSSYLE
jgi:pentatricopeptide repeat protein